MGNAYVELLASHRDYLMLQHQALRGVRRPGDPRPRPRQLRQLVAHVEQLSGADQERIDDFFRYGMWLNVAAAMGVEDLSAGCEWIRAEQEARPGD